MISAVIPKGQSEGVYLRRTDTTMATNQSYYTYVNYKKVSPTAQQLIS
jgi:S-formylglutathione hydrolase FrmB